MQIAAKTTNQASLSALLQRIALITDAAHSKYRLNFTCSSNKGRWYQISLLNEQWLFVQHGCQTGCPAGLTTGLATGWMFVYRIQPVVKPVLQPV